jgi:hypothetical protein
MLQWDDEGIHFFVLDQHTWIDFIVLPLWKSFGGRIILILSQPVFALAAKYCVLWRKKQQIPIS